MQAQIHLALVIVAIFWLVFLINLILNGKLNFLGIIPRRWYGLPGIFCAPFLHGDFNHLFFNSIPLFVLVNFMLTQGVTLFVSASIMIIIVSGLLTWLFARPGIHIGASSLIMGYLSYLLTHAYLYPSISTIILAIVCIYYFGSLILGLFPGKAKVSWEGHLAGFAAGIIAAFY